MQINWFTVAAQVINFLTLVWLLRRFLYQPVLNTIDEREKRIATQLAEAEATKSRVEQEQKQFEQKNADFEQQRTTQLARITEEAQAEQQRLFEKVRTESASLQAKLNAALNDQQQVLVNSIRQKTQQEVIGLTQKVLVDLASSDLEDQTIRAFLKRLTTLSEPEKSAFRTALTSSSQAILVKSAFALSASQRKNIEEAIQAIDEQPLSFQYETSPELIAGLSITTNGYTLNWNTATYLKALQANLADQSQITNSEKAHVS